MPTIGILVGKMNAAQLLWTLFFLKIFLITTYGVLWFWARRSRKKNASKTWKEMDNNFNR